MQGAGAQRRPGTGNAFQMFTKGKGGNRVFSSATYTTLVFVNVFTISQSVGIMTRHESRDCRKTPRDIKATCANEGKGGYRKCEIVKLNSASEKKIRNSLPI